MGKSPANRCSLHFQETFPSMGDTWWKPKSQDSLVPGPLDVFLLLSLYPTNQVVLEIFRAYSINLWITLYVDSVVKKTRDESGLVKWATSSEQWLLNPKRRTAWYRLVKNGFPTPMNQWMMIVPNEARIGSYNLHIINHNTLLFKGKNPKHVGWTMIQQQLSHQGMV